MTVVSPGNQRDRGPEEYYDSEAYELPAETRVRRIGWQADVPEKTWVKAQVRIAAWKEGLGQATWQGPTGPGSWYEQSAAASNLGVSGSWVQYRLALGAINGGRTPRITEVCVRYG